MTADSIQGVMVDRVSGTRILTQCQYVGLGKSFGQHYQVGNHISLPPGFKFLDTCREGKSQAFEPASGMGVWNEKCRKPFALPFND